jgi:phosphatidate cytidylyltransferase
MAVVGLLVAIVSQIGDLSLSLLKRKYGIKDFGKIFPGHGGVLDRFDSVLAVSIILTVCFVLLTMLSI